MSSKTHLSKEVKNEIVKEMRAFHEETMNRLSKGEKHYFYPKVPFLRTNGLRVIGMFRSELEKPDENVYIETINLNYEALDKRRTLYRLRYNPYFKEEYEHVGNDRYNVPMEELEVVWQLPEEPSNETAQLPLLYDTDTIEDNNLTQMTIRDLAAILLRKPVSSKSWLNDLVMGR
jgi:hypothetical protein